MPLLETKDHPCMFDYQSDRPRPGWRPDLLEPIMAWINAVPEADWQYFQGFRVGVNGGFIAKFAKRPDRGGAPREVTTYFDHTYHHVETDTGRWRSPKIVPYHPDHLHVVVNTF